MIFTDEDCLMRLTALGKNTQMKVVLRFRFATDISSDKTSPGRCLQIACAVPSAVQKPKDVCVKVIFNYREAGTCQKLEAKNGKLKHKLVLKILVD